MIIWLAGWDKRLTGWLHVEPGTVRYFLAAVGAHCGDGPLWLFFWLVLIGLGYWHHLAVLTRGGAAWIGAAMVGAAITYSIKFWLKRQRPHEMGGFYSRKYDAHAFPSGHATRMGTVAIFGFVLFGAWGWLFLALSLWVIWSRAALGVHYLGDVVAGYLIGAFSALIVGWAVL